MGGWWRVGDSKWSRRSEQIYILDRYHVIAGNSTAPPSPLGNILDEEALMVHSSLERRV